MSRYALLCFSVALLLASMVLPSRAGACPFCTVVSQTLSEELTSMDAAIIGRLTELPPASPDGGAASEVPKGTFEVVEIIKGAEAVGGTKAVQTLYFGEAHVGDKFLIMGVDPPTVAWSTPMRVSDRAVE
jgi:hypothetical protein